MSYPTTYHDTTLPSGAVVHFAHAGLPVDAPASTPTLLLLHGFPTTSTQFRHLIPLLAETGKYRVLAPDLPAFGLTTVPKGFRYTFDTLTQVTDEWLQHLKITRFAMYVFDFGAPVGFRLAAAPSSKYEITGIVSQNGNAFNEGFGEARWAGLKAWWASGNRNDATGVAGATKGLSLELNKVRYLNGTAPDRVNRIDPERYVLDHRLNLAGAENEARQLDLFWDYRTNPEAYPAWQKWMKATQTPVLAIWGKGDASFIPAGAEAFGTLLGNKAKVVLLDGGHFVLESHVDEIWAEMKPFLASLKW